MSSISGKIIDDTFHMKNKDVCITGRITNDDIMIGLIKLNEKVSPSQETPPQSDTDIQLTGIAINELLSADDYLKTNYINSFLGTYTCVGLIHNNETFLKYPFEAYTPQ